MAKISGTGLAAMALAVAGLWGCLIAERLIVREANLQAAQSLREMRLMRLRRFAQPVSAPLPRVTRPSRRSLG